MNYFFGIKNSEFTSELQIPLFKNRITKVEDINLYKAYIKDNEWKTEILNLKKTEKSFYILNPDEIDNDVIFFLAYENDIENFNKKKLIKLNNFTNTEPNFRSNLKIILKDGGFSSYQSEYPYRMITKYGNIISSVSTLANEDAEKNYILIKNIFESPIKENFNLYLVDIKKKKIEEKIQIKTNFTNFIELKKSIIKPEIFLVTDKYLGVPVYVSVKGKHVSFEHTHPPHEYILSENRYKIVSEFKNEILEIIN